MSELPVSQRYYNQTILISEFILLIKKASESDNRITDVKFTPFVKGYNVTFTKDKTEIRIFVKCRKYSDGCILKIYESSKLLHKGIIKTKEDICDYITRIIK